MHSSRASPAVILLTFGHWFARSPHAEYTLWIAAGPPALEQVREQRGGHAGIGGIGGGALALDPLKAGAVTAPGVAARDADVARDGAQRIGRAMELLAVGGAPRRVAAVKRGGLERGELAREPPDGGGGD